MRTDAPGNFSCEIYIKSWDLGYREGSTQLHIDNCSFCGPIVHGGTSEFPLSAADQAKKNVAARKRMARRNFLKRSAIAASITGFALVGFNQLMESESRVGSSIDTEIAADFTTLDSHYAAFGRPKIEICSASNNSTIVMRTYSWIESRGHSNLYDIICAGLSDSRKNVSYTSYQILRKIDPVDLKVHLPLISDGLHRARFPEIKRYLPELISTIESS